MNNKETYLIINKTTKELIPDSKIILFGSRARLEHSEESDFDFLVITKDSMDIKLKSNYKSEIRKRLAKLKIPVDVIMYSETEIRIKKKITGHIVREIMKDGIPL